MLATVDRLLFSRFFNPHADIRQRHTLLSSSRQQRLAMLPMRTEEVQRSIFAAVDQMPNHASKKIRQLGFSPLAAFNYRIGRVNAVEFCIRWIGEDDVSPLTVHQTRVAFIV